MMTWRTSEGERVLAGAERSLIAHGGGHLLRNLRESGVDAFESALLRKFDPEVATYAVLQVLEALLVEGPVFPLAAWSESIVKEILTDAQSGTESEWVSSPNGEGHGPDWFWRNLIREAEAQRCEKHEPGESCEGNEEFSWGERINFLSEIILWDEDFEMVPSGKGIEYYDDVPALPSPIEQVRLDAFESELARECELDYSKRTV